MSELNFYYEDKYLYLSVAKALEKYVDDKTSDVVFVFVGTDSNIGDSLAPLCSTMLNINNGRVFTYGNLKEPITAKEVPFMVKYLKYAHPQSVIVVVDAAIGKKWDIGRVKVQNTGLKPGLGVNKDLPMMGDISIIGVVGEKCDFKNGVLPQIRLSCIYKMAKSIANGIEIFVNNNYLLKKSHNSFINNNSYNKSDESVDNRLIG